MFRRSVALIQRVGWRALLRPARHSTRWGSLSLVRWGRSLHSRPHRTSSPATHLRALSLQSPQARKAPYPMRLKVPTHPPPDSRALTRPPFRGLPRPRTPAAPYGRGSAPCSPPSSAGGYPEPPPACGCGGYRFPLPLPFSLLHALPCSAPYRRMAELGRHSRGPPSPLGSVGRGPPSPLFLLPAPIGAERCPAHGAGLFKSADASGANHRAGRYAPAFGGLGAAFSLVVSPAGSRLPLVACRCGRHSRRSSALQPSARCVLSAFVRARFLAPSAPASSCVNSKSSFKIYRPFL